MRKYKVFFKAERGVMVYERSKIIFQHFDNISDKVKEGIGVIVEGSLSDKGNYGFADMENVIAVVPRNYYTVDFFANVGVPVQIYQGYHGDSVIFKEIYYNKNFLKAYDLDGNILICESKIIKNPDYEGENSYYTRLDHAVKDWKDITKEVHQGVIESLKVKKTSKDLRQSDFYNFVTRKLVRYKVMINSNGLVFVEGNHDTLVFWESENGDVKASWLSMKIPEELLR